jgi:dTDP-4-amino-4,6-dideoxygalactose transaminase
MKPTVSPGEALHVGRPNLGDRQSFLQRVNDVLDRRWLSNSGKQVQEFESRVSALLSVKHCIAMCNATVALEIAARALGLSGEVIVPSFTFVATAHALQWQEITPVFCDVDPATHNIDPAQVESLITERTTGILAVHLWGRACNIEALEDIARRHNIQLIFDASHAFGCSHNGRMIGGFGRAEVFSFHATKFINTLEGGIVATNDDTLAHKLRMMKNFGFTGYDQVEYLGVNGKMNEVSAAMGLTNLESMDRFVSINRSNYYRYRDHLAGIPGLSVISYDESERCNFQYIVVEWDDGPSGTSRNEMVARLHEHQIIARRYFYPGCHRMEPYRTLFPDVGTRLPNTERLAERLFCLPTGSSVRASDIEMVCDTIRNIVSERV